jgi:hypothetical protein
MQIFHDKPLWFAANCILMTMDPPKWTKGGASVIGGCHGGAFEVNYHMYLHLTSRFPTAGMFEAEL